MDSKLLAGAYSKRYKYIEREQIDNLKNKHFSVETGDVLAKARRLSQETNKRRKKAEQKLKHEQAREEKRRQEILHRRHQEQKDATEKYQRSHVGSARSRSPQRHGNGSVHHGGGGGGGNIQLDEALRLVRGESMDEHSRNAIQRLHSYDQNEQEDKPRASRNQKAHRRSHHSPHHHGTTSAGRPLSGQTLDASLRAELMERSQRNLASSRNRFEQQLEHHQQMLVEQQQKSLREFNQAIRREIDSDAKVSGMEDDDEENRRVKEGDDDGDDGSFDSDSFCSVDSLENEKSSSMNSSAQSQTHQALRQFHMEAVQQRERQDGGVRNTRSEQSERPQDGSMQDWSTRPQSAKVKSQHVVPPQPQQAGVPTSPVGPVTSMTGHIVGPIPQGYYAPLSSGVPPSSTPVIQGNLSYYHDSLETGDRRGVAVVGTALRLPQQPSQPPKQPAPALQYDPQLLASRKFDSRSGGQVYKQDGGVYFQSYPHDPKSRDLGSGEPLTSALTQHEQPPERPKAHVYAWTSPPPVEDDQNASPYTTGMTGMKTTITMSQGTTAAVPPSSFSASVAADRVMATNLHPTTSRTISTAATTTSIYQTVNTQHNREQAYSQASSYAQVAYPQANTITYASQANNNNVHSQMTGNQQQQQQHQQQQQQPQNAYANLPRNQGLKPGTTLTSTGSYSSATGLRFVTTTASSLANYQTPIDASRQHAHSYMSDNNNNVGAYNAGGHTPKGIMSQGSLGLVNGRLTTIDTEESELERRIRVIEDQGEGPTREVKGILKRPDGTPKSAPAGETKFNVHDSVEIAKKQLHNPNEKKKERVKKKGVRFADLQYADVEEESDEDDDSPKTQGYNAKQQTPQRQRPASAKVVSFNPKAGADNKVKGPRIASAGPARNPPATRPKAAAHIIMSGEAGVTQQPAPYPNHSIHIAHGNHGHHETGGPGIAVHKSQLDKKVAMINNNFMSRVPAQFLNTIANTAPAAGANTVGPGVYTVSGSIRNTTTTATATYPATAVSVNGGTLRTATVSAADQGRWASKTAFNPTSTGVLPSHSHFTSHTSGGVRAVYNENGMRIDRTPTDDEINNLWKNMRSMLDVSESKQPQQQQQQQQQQMAPNTNNNSDYTSSRPQVHLSQQYIDGASLIPNSATRVMAGYNPTKTAPAGPGSTAAQTAKPPTQAKNGYMQRYSLLQQRRAPSSGLGAGGRTNGVVEQTVQPMPHAVNTDPRYGGVNISYAPREEMTESMAEFLAAEQTVQNNGSEVRDSRVVAAMQSAGKQQEMYNNIRQKYAKGGPSALSMEEHNLLESLEKLNERLKVVDNRNQATNFSNTVPNHQIYVHGSGFRGHHIISSSSSRRNSGAGGGLKSMGRPVSARLLTRPYH